MGFVDPRGLMSWREYVDNSIASAQSESPLEAIQRSLEALGPEIALWNSVGTLLLKESVSAGTVAKECGQVTNSITRSIDEIGSLRGATLAEVEKLADNKFLQSGWTKKPLKNGDGFRYFDGKGNSFQLNSGYKGGTDMHGGPYIKATQGNAKIRIPLYGNPDL